MAAKIEMAVTVILPYVSNYTDAMDADTLTLYATDIMESTVDSLIKQFGTQARITATITSAVGKGRGCGHDPE